jgi:hypothetical protein
MGFLGGLEGFLGIGGKQGQDPVKANQQDDLKAQQDEKAAGKQKYTFQIRVDDTFKLGDLKVGHAWVAMVSPDQKVQSWGFWGQAKITPLNAFKWVPGVVHSPDIAHAPTAIHTYEIDGAPAQNMLKAVQQREASPGQYQLFQRNCVNFVVDMCHAAGIEPPGFSNLGVANPEQLGRSITKLNASEGENALGDRVAAAPPPGQGGHPA